MYEIIKNVINSGSYKLADLAGKIDKLWVEGTLDETQRDELLELARDGATITAEAPGVSERVSLLETAVDELKTTVQQILEGTASTPEAPQYEAWTPWDGRSNKYQYGALVTHNGHLWESTFIGQNVWEPGAAGITDMFWLDKGAI